MTCIEIGAEWYEEHVDSTEHLTAEVLNDLGLPFDIHVGDHIEPDGYVSESGGVLLRTSKDGAQVWEDLQTEPKVTALRMAESGFEGVEPWIDEGQFEPALRDRIVAHAYTTQVTFIMGQVDRINKYWEGHREPSNTGIPSRSESDFNYVRKESLKAQTLQGRAKTLLGDKPALTRNDMKDIIAIDARQLLAQNAT